MQTPWTLYYNDGAGNGYRFSACELPSCVRLSYAPVQPAHSSSGHYSGGLALDDVELDAHASAELLELLTRVRAAGTPHAVGGRAMGTGLLEWRSVDERGRVLLEQPQTHPLDDWLHTLREKLA